MKRLVPLTDEQRADIVRRYKTEKNVRLRERLHCVLLKADGYTNREAARILHTSEHTVNDWLDRFEEGGLDALCAWEIGGSQARLNAEQVVELQAQLDTHCFQTAKQVCAWVQEQFAIVYSQRGMRDVLKRLGYTPQKAHLVPAQADADQQALFFTAVPASQEATS